MNLRDLGAWVAWALMFLTLVYAVGTLAIEGGAR